MQTGVVIIIIIIQQTINGGERNEEININSKAS